MARYFYNGLHLHPECPSGNHYDASLASVWVLVKVDIRVLKRALSHSAQSVWF